MRQALLVMPREAVERIESATAGSGDLVLRRNVADDLWIVSKIQDGRGGSIVPAGSPKNQAALNRGDQKRAGQWMRGTPSLHFAHWKLSRKPGVFIPLDRFREDYPSLVAPGNQVSLVVTHVPEMPQDLTDIGVSSIAAWAVDRQGAQPFPSVVEPASYGLGQLEGYWNLDVLANASVLVVGVGSIGGSVAQHLAGYGVGSLHLLDPDRLLWHNTVRHVLDHRHVGRYKVDALKDDLVSRWPDLHVTPHVLDVIAHADHVRPLLREADLIVCAADGVGARRVVSHLARRAHCTALLACVLDNGGVGEILRLRPGKRDGCLLCRRANLVAIGGIDPEPGLDADYGTGEVHRPMTAVGSDLHLVGSLTAKAAVATLLETQGGEHDQRLPGEHAIIALRPKPGLAAPYDTAPAGAIAWHPATPPQPGCVTCTPAGSQCVTYSVAPFQ